MRKNFSDQKQNKMSTSKIRFLPRARPKRIEKHKWNPNMEATKQKMLMINENNKIQVNLQISQCFIGNN